MVNGELNNIVDDLDVMADELEARNLSLRTYLGYLPKTYADGDFVIRLLSTTNSSLNSEMVRMDRTYQFVLFNDRPIDLIQRIEDVTAFFVSQVKFPVKGGFLTVDDNIGFSEPFLTEDERTYAAIGVAEAYVTRMRPQEEYSKIDGVEIADMNGEEI